MFPPPLTPVDDPPLEACVQNSDWDTCRSKTLRHCRHCRSKTLRHRPRWVSSLVALQGPVRDCWALETPLLEGVLIITSQDTSHSNSDLPPVHQRHRSWRVSSLLPSRTHLTPRSNKQSPVLQRHRHVLIDIILRLSFSNRLNAIYIYKHTFIHTSYIHISLYK